MISNVDASKELELSKRVDAIWERPFNVDATKEPELNWYVDAIREQHSTRIEL